MPKRFVNSSLQLLKEQLAELNSSMEIYQNREDVVMPMIPLGLKETKGTGAKRYHQEVDRESLSRGW